jgi:hypothetical protein
MLESGSLLCSAKPSPWRPLCIADVALLVLRAVHGLDVLTGASKADVAAAATGDASPEAPAPVGGGSGDCGRRGGRQVEPTSPRQHLIALP